MLKTETNLIGLYRVHNGMFLGAASEILIEDYFSSESKIFTNPDNDLQLLILHINIALFILAIIHG